MACATGVHQDVEQAVEWWRKAASQGNVQAQQALLDLGLKVQVLKEQGGRDGDGVTRGMV